MSLLIEKLSEPQRECLRLVLGHHNSKDIATRLEVSPSAVDKRIERAVQILNAASRFAAARMLAAHDAGAKGSAGAADDRPPREAIDLPAEAVETAPVQAGEPQWLLRRLLGISHEDRLPSSVPFAVHADARAAWAALRHAQSELELGGRRSRMFGDRLFFDPAWNILLDIFISIFAQRRLSVTAVCIGSRVSTATGLRYITCLSEEGLVSRVADVRDGRRTYIELTGAGWSSMIALLA